jgi:hypothetical protein
MSHQTWRDGLLVREADDTARTVTTWDAQRAPSTRPYTDQENADADQRALGQVAETNESSIRDKLRLALETNNAYLAVGTPTAAQTTQQVKALSRTVNGLIRLANHSLESDT